MEKENERHRRAVVVAGGYRARGGADLGGQETAVGAEGERRKEKDRRSRERPERSGGALLLGRRRR